LFLGLHENFNDFCLTSFAAQSGNPSTTPVTPNCKKTKKNSKVKNEG
jgi:hypothetical protein